MHIVLDTNVLLSAAVRPTQLPGRLLASLLGADGRFVVVSTPHLMDEFERTLGYPRIRELIARNSAEALVPAMLERLRAAMVLVEDREPSERWVPDDPDDDWVVQCALTAGADYIVSGDQHLLSLGQVGPVRIVSPREFVTRELETP